jgi:uncharacterized cupin superfamily protein
VFYIIEGDTLIVINGIEYLGKPGDAFICSAGDVHNLWNQTDKDFKLLVLGINKARDEDISWKEEQVGSLSPQLEGWVFFLQKCKLGSFVI